MKNIILIAIIIFPFYSCVKENNDMEPGTEYAYHAHIKSPDPEAKHLNDTIHINVLFESHSGEIVHNIKIEIRDKEDVNNVAYLHEEHVHEEISYDFHEDLVLSAENGFKGSTDWIMEASVWSHDAEEDDSLVAEEIEFHIHPN